MLLLSRDDNEWGWYLLSMMPNMFEVEYIRLSKHSSARVVACSGQWPALVSRPAT